MKRIITSILGQTLYLPHKMRNIGFCQNIYLRQDQNNNIEIRNIILNNRIKAGRATAQAVNGWLLTAKARAKSQVNRCGVCGKKKVAL
jgi:hypothetical protein